MSSLIIGREIDDLTIRQLRSYPDAEAAVTLDAHLRSLERQYRRSFVARGLILLEVEERRLWGFLIDSETGEYYTSFESWVTRAASHSRSDCFAALRAVKELRDIPVDQLLEVPRCNVRQLQKMSSGIRKQPEVLRDAKNMRQKQFIDHMNKTWSQHLEAEDGEEMSMALEMAYVVEGVSTRTEALRAIAVNYIVDKQEEYEGMKP